jgi:DNA polymerase elongation subunit (family B)
MILEIENNDNQLIISYFDAEGKIKIRNFEIPEPKNWTLCGANDPKRNREFSNWDGKPVKQVTERRLNKWSIYEFISNLPEEDRREISALNFPKVQSVDIETEVIDGFPVPEIAREKITTIAIATEANSTVVLGWKPIDKAQEKEIFDQHREYLKAHGEWSFKYICFEDEFNMLYTFINRFVPNFSLMIGWNFMGFDWKYIYNRCRKIGIDPSMASPTKKLQGKDNIPMHVGVIDYLDVYRRWDRTVAIKENNTLDFVSNAVLGVTKLKYSGSLQELYEKDYDKYVLYNAIDAALVCLIHKKLKTINSVFSVSNMCNLSIYKASSAVNLTEALLWKGYYERNMVIADKKVETPRGAYEGAYVKEPEPGIFRAATCFDYASLYPSIMRQYNVSPESFITKIPTESKTFKDYQENPEFIASVTGAVYDNKGVSVLKEILTNLYSQRKTFKNKHLAIELLLSKNKKK